MTVAARILADHDSLAAEGPSPALKRLIEAAWSGGAHPILVTGLPSHTDLSPLATYSSAETIAEASAEALSLVAGTTALVSLPVSHAGIDPETITALIAYHGRTPNVILHAAHSGEQGPVQLFPLSQLQTEQLASSVAVECGDQAAITPSDGRTRLDYQAPPADINAVDPWERRGDDAS